MMSRLQYFPMWWRTWLQSWSSLHCLCQWCLLLYLLLKYQFYSSIQQSLSIDSCEHTTWKNFTSRIQMIRNVDILCLRTLCSVWKSNLFKLFQVFIILHKRIKWRLLNNVKHKPYLLIKLLFLIVYYFEEWTQMIIHFFSKGNSCSMNVRTLLVQKVPLLLYILP